MNGKQRILATLAGEKPDRVPFVPNIWQWFYVNQYNDTLPDVISDAQSPVEVLRGMGADIFSKFDGEIAKSVCRACQYTIEFEGAFRDSKTPNADFASFEGGPIRKERIGTPYGPLTHTWEYREDAGAPFESEHWWKDFDSEYAAIRYWLEDTETQCDSEALQAGLSNVGEDGTILLQLLPTPLKKFHWLAGQEQATFFIMDHPEKMRELASIHERQSLEWLEEVVDLDEVWVFEVPDNVDSMFYPPYWYEEFCLPILKKEAEMVRARGKYLFLHACGHLKALGPLFLETGVACVEGQAPPPLGDWHLHEARALSDRLIVCGGMAAPEQELTGADATERIDAYVRDLFASMGDKRRFLFGSSCNTSPLTPYENLLAFRDAAWRYGRL
ncbi:MAG: hypothetical protein GXP37_08335 [Chloroflexi bacterium]|nr:hypothetical protein [Chloroflexota bacterium]